MKTIYIQFNVLCEGFENTHDLNLPLNKDVWNIMQVLFKYNYKIIIFQHDLSKHLTFLVDWLYYNKIDFTQYNIFLDDKINDFESIFVSKRSFKYDGINIYDLLGDLK